MRDVTDSLDRRALTTSPSAVSDASSATDASSAANEHGSLYGYDASRRSSSSSQQSDVARGRNSAGPLGPTRIPRPPPSHIPSTQSHNPSLSNQSQPLSIKDAYRMAQEEEAAAVAKAAQGSPSPAPRPWRNRIGGGGSKGTPTLPASGAAAGVSERATPTSTSESRMQKFLAQSPLDIGGRRTARRIGEGIYQGNSGGGGQDPPSRLQRRSTTNGDDARNIASNITPAQSEHGDGSDLRWIRYEEDQARMQVAIGEKPGGLFSPKARVSPKIAVAGRELHRRASNTSLGEKSKVPVPVTTNRTTTLSGVYSAPANRGGKPVSYLKRMVSESEDVTRSFETSSPGLVRETNSGDMVYATDPPSAAPIQVRSTAVPSQAAGQTAEADLNESPGKSFAWDADEDFTANDLMASESPRVALQSGTGADVAPDTVPSKSYQSRPRNSKLEEIRQLELEADLIFPEDALIENRRHSNRDEIIPNTGAVDAEMSRHSEHGDVGEGGGLDPQTLRRPGLPVERTNRTLDDIRAREDQPISKREMSAMRLDEIRKQNAESRQKPIDAARKLSHEHLRAEAIRDRKDDTVELAFDKNETKTDVATRAARDRALYGEDSEQIPNTPITIYRSSSTDRGRKLLSAEDGGSDNDTAKNVSVSPTGSRKSSSSTHSRTESQELLRKLARVTTSVVAAAERKDKATMGPHILNKMPDGDNVRGGAGPGAPPDNFAFDKNVGLKLPRSRDGDTLRPTVGFAQLRRQASTESASTKRSSLAQSDGDPTDRIEAEMKLFAAGENHSERGSIRAPSPDENLDDLGGPEPGSVAKSSSMVDDATPRSNKVMNPLMQPTPRVTGAYVETPVTARTEKVPEMINASASEPKAPFRTISVASSKAVEKKRASMPLPGILSLLRGSTGTDTDPDTAAATETVPADGHTPLGEAPSVATKDVEARSPRLSSSRKMSRSRSRSASRSWTPLVNSAKPSSAREDLLAIQRDQQIDDSTVDDFDEILATHTAAGLNDKTAVLGGDSTTDSQRLRRMRQSISTYLLDVQSMKKGIERLEDQVSHPETRLRAAIELQKKITQEAVTNTKRGATTHEKTVVGPIEKTVKDEPGSDRILNVNAAVSKQAKQPTKEHKRQGTSTSQTVPKKENKDDTSVFPAFPETLLDGSTPTDAYVPVYLPRLYRSSPGNTQWTLLGILVLTLSVWLAFESTACALFCRPEACHSGQACQWSPDDPSFGSAIPVKLDQWLTGGQGRSLATWASDEVGDWVADLWDAATGTDIRQVDSTYFTFDEKRRHRRRLQKRGLIQPWTPTTETRSKLEALRRAGEAREEERRDREEQGYSSRYDGGYLEDDGVDDGFEDIVRASERILGDKKVRGWW
ncbi:hypothetical protein HMPREF1624_01798 [Sporothrix schenckii ATCC 58251]|uniref:Uncharacterized protein n=1 Tax=Sporothrix schenckii (strain ATCC 58251 / de Perez 2211183) TaxID=1391915 RepID=U7Q6P0_SPOS1|nr:hypothetical protein HMPREF1624_01798 [Sporothrix schenckii ATCC 58251]